MTHRYRCALVAEGRYYVYASAGGKEKYAMRIFVRRIGGRRSVNSQKMGRRQSNALEVSCDRRPARGK